MKLRWQWKRGLAVGIGAALLALGAGAAAAPHDDVTIRDFLIDEAWEIALARSAAPPEVGDAADVWVLRESGFERVEKGSNGFACMVWRSWAVGTDHYFPHVLGPICFNPPAADNILAHSLLVGREFAAGRSMDELQALVAEQLASGGLRRPGAGAMAYMLSEQMWFGETARASHPHVMFFMPGVAPGALGDNAPGAGLPNHSGHDNFGWVTVGVREEFAVTPRYFSRAVLEHASRPARDREQDAGRKALDVYEWIGIRPGMHVADVFASSGYNTHLLSLALGPGRVYAVLGEISARVKERIGLDSAAEIAARIDAGRLDNVEVVDTLAELPEAQLDAVVSIRNFHDIDWFGGDSGDAVRNMMRALKPGGLVGVVEVATGRTGWDEETHRLNQRAVVRTFEDAGFQFLGSSDLLANPDDDHSAAGFDVGRHTLDRYLLKFRKPDPRP